MKLPALKWPTLRRPSLPPALQRRVLPRHWLLPLGLLLALLLIGGLLSQLHPVTRQVDTGPSAEARSNPWLAAERFLLDRNLPLLRTDSLGSTLSQTPPAGHTLLLLASRQNLGLPERQQLQDWLQRGGHAVVIAESEWHGDDRVRNDWLLDPLQIRRLVVNPHASKPPAPAAGEEPMLPDPWPQLTRLYLENEDAPAYFAFSPRWELDDERERAHAWAGNARGVQLLQLPLGDGLLTVLSDSELWDNAHLGNYDHAWLLWYLCQDSRVILIDRLQQASLWQLLLRHLPHALLAAGLSLLLLLWHLAPRQGPLQPADTAPARSLREHLQAAAGFVARQAGHAALLQRLQQDVHRRACQHHPDFDNLPVTERWQLLARHSQLSASEVREAMRTPDQRSAGVAQFTRQVISLQRLRNAL